MLLALKICLFFTLLSIFIQDFKYREVYWLLFPVVALISAILYFHNTTKELFLYNLTLNTSFVLLLIAFIFLYSKYKMKISVKNTFGLGDALLFVALTVALPSSSFIVLFVFSLIFSLFLHLLLKQFSKYKTVPLAGNMSLFFLIVFTLHWLGFYPNLYLI